MSINEHTCSFVFHRFNWSPECSCICVTLCVCCNKAAIQKETQQSCISPWHVPGCQGVLLYYCTIYQPQSICLNLLCFVCRLSFCCPERNRSSRLKEGRMDGRRGGGKILICPAAAARPKQTMLERQTEESHLSWSFGSGRLVDLDTTVHKYLSAWGGGMFDCAVTTHCLLCFCAYYLRPSALFRFRLLLL